MMTPVRPSGPPTDETSPDELARRPGKAVLALAVLLAAAGIGVMAALVPAWGVPLGIAIAAATLLWDLITR
jgi:hypothetical protein